MKNSSFILLPILAPVILFFYSCVDDEYDLGNISPVISVEADGFAIPLGSSEAIFLSDILEKDDVFELDSIQGYSINLSEDIDTVSKNIDPVAMEIGSIDIEPLVVDFDMETVSDFSFDEMSSESEMTTPDVNITDEIDLPPVYSVIEEDFNLPVPIPPGQPIKTTIHLGPEDIDISLDYALSENEEIESLHSIYFGESDRGQLMEFNIDYSAINAVIEPTQSTQTLNLLEFEFPVDDFELETDPDSPFAADSEIVNGHIYRVTDAELDNNSDTVTFSFFVKSLTLEESGDFNYDEHITYELEYFIDVVTGDESVSSLTLKTEINEELEINYAEITAAPIDIEDIEPKALPISSVIDGLEYISVIQEITFEPSSIFNISVNDPDIPLSLSDHGSFNVDFPWWIAFDLDASELGNSSFDTNNNVLQIPADELFDADILLVLYKMDMSDFDIIDGEMVIEDKIEYYSSDLQFLPELINSAEVEDLEDVFIEIIVPETELSVADAELTTNLITTEVEETIAIDIDEEVPDELITITSLMVDEDEPCQIVLDISFDNLPSDIDEIELRDFDISFPPFLVFDPDDNVIDGLYTITGAEGTFPPKEGFSKTFDLVEFDFSYLGPDGLTTVIENGVNKIILDEDNAVTLDGEVIIDDATFSGDEIEGIVIRPEIFLDKFVVSKLRGKVELDIDPIDESLDFDTFDENLDFLTNNANLGFTNPQILLSIGNTTGIPFEITMNLKSQDADGNMIPGTDIDEIVLYVEGADVLGEPTMFNFLISAQGTEMGGYEPVHAPDLPNLLQEIPDKISFQVLADTDKLEPHEVDLSKDLEMTLEYELIIPLQFDELNLNYEHAITDIVDYIDSIDKDITEFSLSLSTEVENTIPLEFDFDVIPIDKSGNVMSDITTSVEKTIPAGNLEEIATEEILFLFEDSEGAINELGELWLNVNASTNETVGGASLKAEQYIQFRNMKLLFSGGMEINLDD